MATAEGGLALAGQTFTGKYPDGSYHAVVAEVTPGQPLVYTILADLDARVKGGLREGEQLDAAQKLHALERDLISLSVE